MGAAVRSSVSISRVPRLVSLSGKTSCDHQIRAKSTLIGSADEANFVIKDPTISARHAKIRRKRGRYFVTDL